MISRFRYALPFVALPLSALICPTVHADPPAPELVADLSPAALAKLTAELEAARTKAGIPGMALVVVQGDRIVLLKGFGQRDIAKRLPVTPDTLFAIGSSTKAFTALSVLMAADDGKLSLDDSPKKYLPYFHMSDPETDKNITVRDLMCHRSGLAQGNRI